MTTGADIAVVAGAEVVKLLIQLAIQQAQRANMNTEQVMALYLSEREKFKASNPEDIPDPK